MVNILVPTDFSDLSKVAIRYAVKMANKMDGNITLLHVLADIVQPTRASMRLRLKALERELLTIAEEDFVPILEEADKLNKTNHSIKHKIQMGQSFNNTVKRFAKKHRSGLIIMGTRGASGLKKFVMGSNTTSMVEVSHIPVLAVPEDASFKAIKNVVFASNLEHIDKELKAMLPYLKVFGATLHVLHITSKGKDLEALADDVKAKLKKTDYRKSTVTIRVSDKIDWAIESFVEEIKPDMLAMFTTEHKFFDKLFNRSITRKMAFHSHVPLLAFKRK
jgi:nucleotide-binding universal stress UspA family protein